jgi:GH35 family endo-1,4-beta-xylanase
MRRKILLLLSCLLVLSLCLASAAIMFFRANDPLKNADQRIRQFRMTDAEISITDGHGHPLPGIELELEQTSHEFIFGCAIYDLDLFPDERDQNIYLARFNEIFNTAVIVNYWGMYEPEPGKTGEKRLRKLITRCKQNHTRVLVNALVDSSPLGTPPWLKPSPGIEKQIQKFVQSQIRRFQPEVDYWVVTNEASVAWPLFTVAGWIKSQGPAKATAKALSWSREAAPSGVYLTNDYNISEVFDYLVFLYNLDKLFDLLHRGKKTDNYFAVLEQLKALNSMPDAIGIQAHMHLVNWPLWWADRMVKRYGQFGVPLYISEVTILSGKHRIIKDYAAAYPADWWPTSARQEQIQADYAERFYTLLFSRPEVMGISWFNLSDRYAYLQGPGGLLRSDLSPKPAYFRLKDLITRKWHTKISAHTGPDGRLGFRGFYGTYKLTVKTPSGAERVFQFNLAKNGHRSFVFRLPKK